MEIDEEIIKYQKGLIPKEVFFETLERGYRKRIVGFLLATSPSAEKLMISIRSLFYVYIKRFIR